jgi:glycerophosphoryl diester phosphodiesterase
VGIELDIHRTADGEVVVFHDNTLARMCRDSRRPEDMTLAELKDCRLLGTAEAIPSLREVLELVNGRVPLIVELKGESGDTSLCEAAMPLLENYRGAYCVESFNPLLVRAYAKLAPHVMRGILTTKFRRDGEKRGLLGWALTHMLLNFLCRPDFVAVRHPYGNMPAARICRKMGAGAFAWTVKEIAEYRKAEPYFDAFICENVDTLLRG